MMGPVDVTALRNAHSAFLADLTHQIDAAQSETGRLVVNHVETHSGFKRSKGGLAKKTDVRLLRTRHGNLLTIRNTAKYALAQEFGSGTHAGRGKYLIKARRARALRFVSGGRVFVRRAVMHPGVPATHFLYRAVMAAESHDFQFLRHRMADVAVRFSRKRV